MSVERETIVTSGRPLERETIVTNRRSDGFVIALILALLLVLGILWLTNGLNFGGTSGGTVDIDVPAVTVTPDGQ